MALRAEPAILPAGKKPPEHQLPEVLDAPGVLPDEQGLEVLHHPLTASSRPVMPPPRRRRCPRPCPPPRRRSSRPSCTGKHSTSGDLHLLFSRGMPPLRRALSSGRPLSWWRDPSPPTQGAPSFSSPPARSAPRRRWASASRRGGEADRPHLGPVRRAVRFHWLPKKRRKKTSSHFADLRRGYPRKACSARKRSRRAGAVADEPVEEEVVQLVGAEGRSR